MTANDLFPFFRRRQGFGLSVFLWVSAGCAEPPPPAPITTPQPLTLQPVAWNPAMADLGRIVALTELQDELVIYGDQGVSILAGGAVAASDNSVRTWLAAATLPAPDGTGDWAVAIDGMGRVQRLRARSMIEDDSDRYGLSGVPASALAATGGTGVAFALGPLGLAVSDGTTITRYDTGALAPIAGGGGRVAGVAAGRGITAIAVDTGTVSTYALPDAAAIAFTHDGRLIAATAHALYLEGAGGLDLLYRDDTVTFHSLTASTGWVWAATDTDLFGWDGASLYRASGLAMGPAAILAGSTSGDAWILDAGKLARYTRPTTGDEATWRSTVLPVYARVCSACHSPGGTSGIEMSTYDEWLERREKVYLRVIVKGDMPQGRTLGSDDRSAIAAWAMPPK